MRVKTKYGNGTLIGISTLENHIGYKVLLDNLFNEDINDGLDIPNEIKILPF